MPTISMLYGILVRLFFMARTNTMCLTYMQNTKGKSPYTQFLMEMSWQARFLQRNTSLWTHGFKYMKTN